MSGSPWIDFLGGHLVGKFLGYRMGIRIWSHSRTLLVLIVLPSLGSTGTTWTTWKMRLPNPNVATNARSCVSPSSLPM